MKVRTILLSMVLVAGVSLNASAQFKIGGKSISTKKIVNAASDAAKAVTLSDEDVAVMAREYIQAAPASDCISTTFTRVPKMFFNPLALHWSTKSAMGLEGVMG